MIPWLWRRRSAERARRLVGLMAKNQTWQVPTLVWERGQWLVDDIDKTHDPLTKYAPHVWKDQTWPMFVREIMEGMEIADLVLLDANPLDDINNTLRIRAVLLAGRYFDRAALDRMLKGVAVAAAKSPPLAKQASHGAK